jgi:heptosyltransferase-2
MHIVVIMPRWVGDVVMATPLLRGLRRHFAGRARITGVMRPLASELLAGADWFDHTIRYDRFSTDSAIRFAAVARQLRADRPDVAIIVPNSLSSAALSVMGGARRRIGMAMHWRQWLLTDPVQPPRKGGRIEPFSSAAYPVWLAERLGVPPEPLRLELMTTVDDEIAADGVLTRLFPGRDGPLVILNDNSSNGTSRAWGTDRLAKLAQWLAGRISHARILVHCGPGDRGHAADVVRTAADAAIQGVHDESQLPLGLSKALVRRSAAMVTSDSGPRHLAAAFGVPTVVMLGPTDPRLGRSMHDPVVEMRLDLPCSPCGQRFCPLGHHDCMRLLSVEDVGAHVLNLLETNR